MASIKWLWGVATLTPTIAVASHLGVVNFANGSTQPAKIPGELVARAQVARRKPGHVVPLRGGGGTGRCAGLQLRFVR